MDDAATTVIGGALGGAGLLGIGLKVWSAFNQTHNANKAADLGTAYQQHMYARLKELENREEDMRKTILVQTETIGSLKREILELRSDLTEAQEKYREAKRLLESMTTAYTKAKDELSAFENKMASHGVRPTGTMPPSPPQPRPWMPGGGK